MKVLISRPDKIGDLVLALHGAKQLKLLRPQWEIYLHVSEYTRPLAENLSFIDGIVTLDEPLKPYEFDAAIDLMAKPNTAKLYQEAGIPIRIGNSARWFRFRYNRTRWLRRSEALINEAEYNWKLIALIDRSLKNLPLTSALSRSDYKELPETDIGNNRIILMPGVSKSAEAWDLSHWIELALELARSHQKVLFLLGPAEHSTSSTLKQKFSSHQNISIYSSSHLIKTLGILKNGKAYVGPSTGITHLASSLGLSGAALYPLKRSMHPRRWQPFQTAIKILSLTPSLNALEVASALDASKEILNTSRDEVSAFVICKNEEKNIRRCLESIKWCDQIIVVDSGSSDRTIEICKEYTDNIIMRHWPGHREQKQFALEQCTKKWILNLDSDEELSSDLCSKIQDILVQSHQNKKVMQGYFLCRVVFFLNRWWDRGGWFPEYRMRFFQRQSAVWGGVNPHEKALVRGHTAKLSGFLHHYTFSNLTELIETLNRFSANSAATMHKEGKSSGLWKVISRPPFRFLKFYILKGGFREGTLGFIVACCEAFYTFLKYSKLWEQKELEEMSELLSEGREPLRPGWIHAFF